MQEVVVSIPGRGVQLAKRFYIDVTLLVALNAGYTYLLKQTTVILCNIIFRGTYASD